MGSVLKIHPIIHIRQNGTRGVLNNVRGKRKKALDRLITDFRDDLTDIKLDHVFITHTLCEVDAAFLVEELQTLARIENLLITNACPTIASHCGPNTIGIIYIRK